MLDLGHEAWQDRIRYWADDSKKRFGQYAERVKRVAGPAHKASSGWEQDTFDPINHSFVGMRTWTGQFAYGLPRATVGSSREKARATAEQGSAVLNRLIQQSNLRETNELLVADLYLDFCVTRSDSEPAPGFSDWEDPFYWPTDTRIAPWDFLYDQQAYESKAWRYQGDRGTRDLEDVIAEAEEDPESGWNLSLLREIHGRIVEHPAPVKDAELTPMEEDRKQFRYWRIYCPEVTADDLREMGVDVPERDANGRQFNRKGGYNGAEFTVLDPEEGRGNVAEFPRKPRMWWGPREGPYTFLSAYLLSNDALGLSPDTASKGQQVVANEVARACLAAIERQKTIGLVGSSAAAVGQAAKNAVDGDLIVVPDATEDMNKRVATLTLGGLTQELLTANAWSFDLLQKASGMGPSQYGEVNNETATSNALAAQATSLILGAVDVKFREFQAKRLKKWLWWVLKNERFVLVMEDEVLPETGEVVKPVAVGGNSQAMALKQAARVNPGLPEQVEALWLARTGEKRDFESLLAMVDAEERTDPAREANEDEIDLLDLSVAPLSMSRSEEGMQQARLQTQLGIMLPMFQAMVTTPFWDWEDQVREVGDMMNMPGLERRLNTQKLAAVQQMALGAMFPPPEQTPSEPVKPRVAADKGPKPVGATPMKGQSTGAVAGAASKPAGPAKPMAKPMKAGGAKK